MESEIANLEQEKTELQTMGDDNQLTIRECDEVIRRLKEEIEQERDINDELKAKARFA